MPDPTWSKLELVGLIEKHVGPTEKLWKAKKSTLVKILHTLERGKIDVGDIFDDGHEYTVGEIRERLLELPE